MTDSFPRRHLFGIGAAFASAATIAAKPSLAATSNVPQAVQWDSDAADEVMMLLHHMHRAWNEADIDFIKRSITDDGFIGTFELTSDEHAAVLNSRDELVTYVEKLFSDMNASGVHTEASPRRSHQVLATATFAICTEQCDLIERHADGSRYVLPHRGTSALAKTADGWKFVHWHVSQGGPGKRFNAAGQEVI